MNLTKPQQLIYDMEKFSGGTIAVICGSVLFEGKRELAELQNAVNELYRLNDALRIRIAETPDEVHQEITLYSEQKARVIRFKNKAEMTNYADKYAKEPLNFKGPLCEIAIVILPERYGILVKLHHIISDAWTLTLIASQFYAVLNGETPVVYSYTDYPGREQAYLQSPRYQNDKTFFLEQFKQCDEIVYLSEKPNASLTSYRKTFVIDSEKAKEIINYISHRKISAFTFFMTVLAVYISRLKMNAERFYIGTAVLNRTGIKEKNTMGMFINTVPMLAELDNRKTFAENLSSIEKSVFSVLRHQKYNYGDILSSIRREYGFNEKLYDVMLSYQNATVTGANFETAWYHSGMQNESLQLHIDDHDKEGIFRIHYDYLSDKFTEHEICMLHQHMETLLFDAIKADSKTIYDLEILSADEKRRLLYDCNDTAVDYPRDRCVHQLFEEQARKLPEKTAVIACDRTLTNAELNEQANRIAHSLSERSVKPGDIVAFMLSRRSYLIAAMFGILKAGAAYLPIDIDSPRERIDYILEDSGAKLLITDATVIDLSRHSNSSNPGVLVTSDSLCYCIYTSGSTGNPKGVQIRHRNFINFCQTNRYNRYQNDVIGSSTVILSTFKCCFDAFGGDYAMPLLNGRSILLASEDDILDAKRQKMLAQKYQADVIQTTPSVMQSLCVDSEYQGVLKRANVILLAAENIPSELIHYLRQYTSAIIYNGYGPSEATIGVCYSKLSDGDITIGKPIANTQIYIVDRYMQLVPIGVIGELCIAGDGVGAGYLNRPELTAEKFIDNPFGAGKLYKTGDLAYWREDGNIAFVGRNDFQVKIRGLRIELGEIENAICGVDGITQAVVVVRKNQERRQLICAFYTGAEIDVKEIRTQIGKDLPQYMLPHIFTHLAELPLTSSGKVNRKTLPEVDLYTIDAKVDYVAPQTEQEILLVNAIETVLGVENVGILDNFFDLGGDSLKAIELISKLEIMGYHTDMKTIFECAGIIQLAEKLTFLTVTEEIFTYTGDIPATPAQMRVYTAQGVQSNSTIYNVPYVFKVKSLNAEKLQFAVNQIIARHEILRTHFENKDGNIIQIINDTAVCSVERLTTGDISAFIRPFDLSKAPLLRVGYFENTVMVDMHHIITDGSSMPIFLRELNELYMGRELSNPPVQYKQFAVQQQGYTESENYWLSVYQDELPILEINTDFKRGRTQNFHGSAIYESIPFELHRQIHAFCKKESITPFVFYLAGLYILLSKYSGCEDIIVGLPISGRRGKYLDTIGMFVNTVALRCKPSGEKTVAAFLREVKDNSVAAIAHQDYPYGTLVKKLNANTTGRNPLFDVMFAYQSEQMTEVVFGDNPAELLPIPVATAKYDLTFNIMPGECGTVLMVEYCTGLYKEQTIHRYINSYEVILQQMLAL